MSFSFSNILINYILKRRNNWKKRVPGSYGKFFRDGGNELLYKFLKLNDKSVVIDAGCYEGEFTKEILIRYGCKVLAFEPLDLEYKKLNLIFRNNKSVKLYKYALLDNNCRIYFNIDGLNSSIVNNNNRNRKSLVRAINILDILKKYSRIDLLKLNVEGAEYKILAKLINSHKLRNINSYLIQFHPIVNSKNLRACIRKSLLKNKYKLIFNYDYVWELWSKK
jgi:FkbM family methyltransferase